VKNIKVLVNFEKISFKMTIIEGFSDFIANQWKSFIIIYAILLIWDLLDKKDWKILFNFVNVYFLLVAYIINNNILDEV